MNYVIINLRYLPRELLSAFNSDQLFLPYFLIRTLISATIKYISIFPYVQI